MKKKTEKMFYILLFVWGSIVFPYFVYMIRGVGREFHSDNSIGWFAFLSFFPFTIWSYCEEGKKFDPNIVTDWIKFLGITLMMGFIGLIFSVPILFILEGLGII